MRAVVGLFAAVVAVHVLAVGCAPESTTPTTPGGPKNSTSPGSSGLTPNTAPSIQPISGCQLAGDQKGSLMPALPDPKATYTVLVDSAFSLSEQNKIQQAIETWNQVSQRKAQRMIWQSQVVNFNPATKTQITDGCTATTDIENGFFILKDTDMNHWQSLGNTTSNMAVTLRCSSGNQIQKQVILVNTTLIDARQFGSVVLHELGHALGLNHSCNDSSSEPNNSFLNCSQLANQPQHPYHVAVMYPTLRAASQSSPNPAALLPEIKEVLQSNDVERAYCLIGP